MIYDALYTNTTEMNQKIFLLLEWYLLLGTFCYAPR